MNEHQFNIKHGHILETHNSLWLNTFNLLRYSIFDLTVVVLKQKIFENHLEHEIIYRLDCITLVSIQTVDS